MPPAAGRSFLEEVNTQLRQLCVRATRHHSRIDITPYSMQYMLPINNTGTSTVCIFNARVQG